MFRGSYTAGSVAFLLLSTTLPAFCLHIFPRNARKRRSEELPLPPPPAYKTAPASITETGAVRLFYGYFFQALTQNLARGLWVSPAYAGKSLLELLQRTVVRDHPRVCGEKRLSASLSAFFTGSSPRMRGKGKPAGGVHATAGITPACAGKRKYKQHSQYTFRDHPRVCGKKTKKIP